MGSAPKVRYRKRLCRDCSGTLLPTVGDESPREGRESRENSSERILSGVVESDVRFTKVFALNCACIGGNTKTPLGIISFTEYAMLALMGFVVAFGLSI